MRHRVAWILSLSALAGGCGDDAGGFGPVSGVPAALVSPLGVWAFSPTDVWFIDGSSTVHRFDGDSWSLLATPSTGGLGCIFALSTSDVWLCAGGDVVHWDGARFTVSDVTGPTGLDGLTSIWASARADVWAVGDDAIVAHWNGAAWSRTIAGSPFKSSIWGSSPTDVYALGTFDLSHYDGVGWSEIHLEGGGGAGQVWGTGASDVWVMTGSDRPAHFDGQSWTTLELEIVGDLAAVWGPSPDDLWAAGSAGSISHYDGSRWSELTHQEIGAPYLRQLTAVHGSSSSDVWIIGHQLGEGGVTRVIYHRGP